ncbi:SURF1 family protein [Aquabacter sp. CN5-332]|uniref:SURF1 family protein n=1 Tax=Aquabacter sp. CN5-332 TaxID=3156608 RepID=UPI0032B44672
MRAFAVVALYLASAAGLCALGVWQLERRTWKLDVMDRVEQRIHAPPVSAPGPAAWPSISAAGHEYLHVRVSGHFLNDRGALVQAVTERGGGYWLLVPFQTSEGFTALVNRGFVPPDLRDPARRSAGEIEGETTVSGLLRMSEPKGAFLRSNDPEAGRWYSRDVPAIATAQGLGEVAPYFIDADARPNPGGFPVGGLTIVHFPNNHLVYALTWFALAAMAASGAIVIWARRA